jgi:hypothetical protein
MSATISEKDREFRYRKAVDSLLPWFRRETPKLSNATNQYFADEIGRLNEMRKDIEKVEKILKTIYKTRKAPEIVRGDEFEVELSMRPRRALDQTRAKEYFEKLGILDEYMVESEVETLNVKRY